MFAVDFIGKMNVLAGQIEATSSVVEPLFKIDDMPPDAVQQKLKNGAMGQFVSQSEKATMSAELEISDLMTSFPAEVTSF